jgi:AcrR family transcriptional regulator
MTPFRLLSRSVTEIVGERIGGRRDAQRNHELLIESARALFSEQGVDAPLEEVARRAGVGIGTLYRHFATRDALVETIVERRIGELSAIADDAMRASDGWEALVRLLEQTLALHARDRMLKDILVRYPPGPERIESAREELRQAFERVLDRARRERALRDDFTLADLALLLWSFAPVIDATADVAPNAWRRHLAWLLDGLRADAPTAQTEPALSDGQLGDSMQALRERRPVRHRPR